MDILETRQVAKGSAFALSLSGGGGYGDPREREPELVLRDVENGYVTRRAAEEVYGVVLTEDGTAVDAAATRRRRGHS
jgi:N-methylhydantoinase B